MISHNMIFKYHRMEVEDLVPTVDNLIKKYGDNYKKTANDKGFCAHSYIEDMFLMQGGRKIFDFRLEWNVGGKYVVAYIQNDTVIRVFK